MRLLRKLMECVNAVERVLNNQVKSINSYFSYEIYIKSILINKYMYLYFMCISCLYSYLSMLLLKCILHLASVISEL